MTHMTHDYVRPVITASWIFYPKLERRGSWINFQLRIIVRNNGNTPCPDPHEWELSQMFRSHLKKYLTLDFKWNVLLKLAFVCNLSLMFPRFIIPLLANLAPGARRILRPAIRSSAPRIAVGVYFSRARTRPRLSLVRRAVPGCDWLDPVVRQCVTRPQQLPRAYIGSDSGHMTMIG